MSYTAATALGRATADISGVDLTQVAEHNARLATQLTDGLIQRGGRLLTPATRSGGPGRSPRASPAATARPSPPN